jgi:hypothetical protein
VTNELKITIAHYLMAYVDGSNEGSNIKKWLKQKGVIAMLNQRNENTFRCLVDGIEYFITAAYA